MTSHFRAILAVSIIACSCEPASSQIISGGGGGGGGVSISTQNSWSAGQGVPPVALTDAATITPDLQASNNFTVTIAGNRTIANPANQIAGMCGFLSITQDATGSRTLSWGARWHWSLGAAPTLSTAGGSVDVVSYCTISATYIAAQLSIAGVQ